MQGNMNNTTEVSPGLENTEDNELRFWVIAPFVILILTTCIANGLVIAVTTMDTKLKGVTYMYVTSLAVADFMVSIT